LANVAQIQIQKIQQVEAALSQAKALRRAKRYNEAAELLLGALNHGVQADRILFQLGNVFFDAGDLSRAEYSYRRATEENPQHANALHNLAVVYHKQGKVAESVKLQRQAVRLGLRGKAQEHALEPEVASWARKLAYRGFLVVALLLTTIAVLLYLA
jgi:tetratricopeptide (TPR) repeat protein